MHTIEELATMTGLTSRTLRNYIKAGILKGSKETGCWEFSDEQIDDFVSDPNARASIKAKHSSVVYDFLAGQENSENETCVLLDITVSEEKAKNISDFFCKQASEASDIRYSYRYQSGKAHFVLKGAEETVRKIMEEYYRFRAL